MFRSTESTGSTSSTGETVGVGGIATPYFMLIQMNNAALLEAYATLGISARPAKISEKSFPSNFSLAQALAGLAFGTEDVAMHPAGLHADGPDPIVEAENKTTGLAADAIALGQTIAARFGANVADGGTFGALIETALAAAATEIDFDLDAAMTGAMVIARSSQTSSVAADGAGAAAFSGFRMDYRPETAPSGPKRVGVRSISTNETQYTAAPLFQSLAAVLADIAKSRKRGAGTGRVVRGLISGTSGDE